MNWIILNGKRSTLIKGLIIRSLPPITKPLVRTSVDTIDGRDGDIVTRLGYAAYDKTVEIGLAGNYDVDQVINYFASDGGERTVSYGTGGGRNQGHVTFSNEPDKYYRYCIFEAIDFERLLRFKTATVTFHVQPFKYSAVDELVDVTASGTSGSMTLYNLGNVYAKPSLTVYGSGTVNLLVNDRPITLDMSTANQLTLNSEDMNVYSGGTLKNRLAIWHPRYLYMGMGSNTISWSGSVTRVAVKDYARWI